MTTPSVIEIDGTLIEVHIEAPVSRVVEVDAPVSPVVEVAVPGLTGAVGPAGPAGPDGVDGSFAATYRGEWEDKSRDYFEGDLLHWTDPSGDWSGVFLVLSFFTSTTGTTPLDFDTELVVRDGAEGPEGPAGADGAPGAPGADGADGAAAVWTQLTQAEYDALSPPDPGTLYIIVG